MAGAENIARWLKRAKRRLFLLGSKERWHRVLRGITGTVLGLMLFGCVNRSQPVQLLELPDIPTQNEVKKLNGSISEVAPPAVFLDLDELLDSQPQVAIASPQPDQVLTSTELSAQIKLRGLSIYKDEKLQLGPHLQVSLDNQPARSIYSLDEAIEFTDLAPGSHTLRVLAVKPWGESFKNEAAYAQTTFHVFAKTGENTPRLDQPQLIYSEPQGTYGAQPILLDFYLNNAPLHFIAETDSTVTDWKIRGEVNGQSFVFDQWQPIYLKGLKPGQNWVQLTLIDAQGNPIDNAFNSTVRIINYDPDQRDTLAKMTRGELQLKDVGQIVDPNYEPPVELEPTPLIEPSPPEGLEPEPELTNPKDIQVAPIPVEPPVEPPVELPVEPPVEPPTEPESNSDLELEVQPESENEIDYSFEDEKTFDEEKALGREEESQQEPASAKERFSEPEQSPETDLENEPSIIPLVQPQPDSDAVNKPSILSRVQTFWQQLKGSDLEQSAPANERSINSPDTETTDLQTNRESTQDETFEKSVTDEPVTDEPLLDEPVIDNSDIDEPDIDEPDIDEPGIHSSVADESATDESATDDPVQERKFEPEQPSDTALEDEPSVIPLAQPPVEPPDNSETATKPNIFNRLQNTWQQLQTANSSRPAADKTPDILTNDKLTKDEPSEKSDIDLDQSISDEPVSDDSMTEQPVLDEFFGDEPVIDPTIADELERLTIPETLTSPNEPSEVLIPQAQ